MSFVVWVSGPDGAGVQAVADEIARRLAARQVPVESLDLRTPGIDALLGDGAEGRAAFVAAALVRHGIATVVALPGTSRAARERARAAVARMIEVYVPTPGVPAAGYEPPDRPEVEVEDPDGVARVLRTLEVLDHLPRADDRGYTDEEEREVIRRLKAFGYL